MILTKNGKTVEMMFGTGASSHKEQDALCAVIRTALENGIRGFDTAPSYRTEEVLGKSLKRCMSELEIGREGLFIQTKVDAWQMMESGEEIRRYVTEIMKKMGLDYLDSLLVHWPVPEYLVKTWKCFVGLKADGLVRSIGICNVRMRQLDSFLNYDIMPEVVQIERNPLRTCDREIDFCRANGITVQAYSPLCKMHEDIRTSSFLANLSEKYGKSIGQIVLKWHMATGVVPIFTSKNSKRIMEYSSLSGFELGRDDIAGINGMNKDYKMYLEAVACPGF